MKTTIDSAGRIVVPKSLRQALNIKPGQTLDIRAGDGRLEIEIAATPMTLKKRGKDVVAVPDVGLPTLTADAVRETLDIFGGESGGYERGRRCVRLLARTS